MSEVVGDGRTIRIEADPLETRVAALEAEVEALKRLFTTADPLEAGRDDFLGRIAARRRASSRGGIR